MANWQRARLALCSRAEKLKDGSMVAKGVYGLRAGLMGVVGAALVSIGAALAAAPNLDNVRLSNDVVPAPFGYEAAAARYTVSEETPLYVSPYIYPGTVGKTMVKPGTAVEVQLRLVARAGGVAE